MAKIGSAIYVFERQAKALLKKAGAYALSGGDATTIDGNRKTELALYRARDKLQDNQRRLIEFATTRRYTPLTTLMALAMVHATVADEGRVHSGASYEESDELLRTLIAIVRGAAQS